MNISLNEVEATAKRAARGAGYPWGLAEEASKATRWLCANRLDGCAALAGLLQAGLANTLSAHTPRSFGDDWRGDAQLCALACGAALSDRAGALPAPVSLHDVGAPLLLLPFLASVARLRGEALSLSSDTGTAIVGLHGVRMTGTFPAHATVLTLTSAEPVATPDPKTTRATPSSADWAILNALAHRTYAPATEESRLLGAGAGLSDND